MVEQKCYKVEYDIYCYSLQYIVYVLQSFILSFCSQKLAKE